MNASATNNNEWVMNTSEQTFEQDVFERSKQVPVIVDFWAAWCQPCRMLGPILEKLAAESPGQFVLVKADTEQVPNAAMAFRVQSIPAVYAVVNGEIVDGFVGLLPEPRLREWIDRITMAGELQRAQVLEATEPTDAQAIYRRLHEKNPQRAEARIGLARIALQQGATDEAQRWIRELEERGFLEPEAQKIKTALELETKRDIDVDALRAKAAATPGDLQLQLQLAEGLAGQQQYEEALQILLSLVQRDRKGVGEPARALMVDIFRILPDDSELTSSYRRQLASALY